MCIRDRATTDGSRNTIPCPFTYTSTLAVPKSIPISLYSNSLLFPNKAIVSPSFLRFSIFFPFSQKSVQNTKTNSLYLTLFVSVFQLSLLHKTPESDKFVVQSTTTQSSMQEKKPRLFGALFCLSSLFYQCAGSALRGFVFAVCCFSTP